MPFPTQIRFIEAAELQLGTRLPTSLRDYLLKSNGAEIELLDEIWRLHPVFDDSDIRRAKRSASHIVAENSNAKGWRGFPNMSITIATDDSGNHLIYFAESNANLPARNPIYVWWHENVTVEKVAEDFSNLLE
jgi:SMI1 / KNR4 family (SUKH-1)